MPKRIPDHVYDTLLQYIKNNATKMVICQGEPADYSEATTDLGTGSGKALGEVALTGSDFTISDGDSSGRKIRAAAQNGIDVDVDGDMDHLAVIDDANSRLMYVNEQSATTSVSAGGTVDVQAHDVEVAAVT